MRVVSLAFAAMLATALLSPRAALTEDREPAVLELFMSQSCAACPPAVRLLGELIEQGNVIALTWPVDYWDYTGWKDTFAAPGNSKRQKAYNDQLGLRYLYTPQMFINGASQVVGSDREDVLAALEEPAKRLRIEVKIEQNGNQVTVSLPEAPAALPATVWLVRYDHVRNVDIGAGENAGKTLMLHNVVRDAEAIGTWDGEAMTINLTIPRLTADDREACAILVQTQGTGPIIGAANLDFASLSRTP